MLMEKKNGVKSAGLENTREMASDGSVAMDRGMQEDP